MDAGGIEVLGRAWLTARLVREGIELARPERDIGYDLIAYPPDVTWMLPIQLKTIGRDGCTVYWDYIGRPLGIVYVLLGDADGGDGGRSETTAHLLTPKEAWDLPRALGRSYGGPDRNTYRFGALTSSLVRELGAHRVEPGSWQAQFRRLAPLRTPS